MLPALTRSYQNHTLDSTRWAQYAPREGDLIVSSPYKSGTTWTQEIVLYLVFLGQEAPYRESVSPWFESRLGPLQDMLAALENQRHRRFIKTHLALDGLPFYPHVKYIVVGRDPRDVFMSLWNHYASHTPAFVQFINAYPGRVGPPFPVPPDSIRDFWRDWISRGWFDWEHEGYPYWGNMHHVQTWWTYRHLPNTLLVHFADLLTDCRREIRRIAAFLDVAVSDEQIATIADATSLGAMRVRAERNDRDMRFIWTNGAQSFFYRGTNGRWKDVLSADDIAMYDATANRVLTPDCRAWLEQGGPTP